MLDWLGFGLLLLAAALLLGKRMNAAHWPGALGLAVVLFTRAYDEIAGRVSGLPYSDVGVWRGSEFTAAGILLPAAGMPLWVGWALVIVGLVTQGVCAARLGGPPAAGRADSAGGAE